MSYLYANFSLPRPLCSRFRLDERDRQTSDVRQTEVRQKHRLMPPPYEGGGIIIPCWTCRYETESQPEAHFANVIAFLCSLNHFVGFQISLLILRLSVFLRRFLSRDNMTHDTDMVLLSVSPSVRLVLCRGSSLPALGGQVAEVLAAERRLVSEVPQRGPGVEPRWGPGSEAYVSHTTVTPTTNTRHV